MAISIIAVKVQISGPDVPRLSIILMVKIRKLSILKKSKKSRILGLHGTKIVAQPNINVLIISRKTTN